MMNCVYILVCKNLRYYIGSTGNLENRLDEHIRGKVAATKKLRPLNLVFSQKFETRSQAYKAERWLKKQKSRQIIEKIIQDGTLKKFKGD